MNNEILSNLYTIRNYLASLDQLENSNNELLSLENTSIDDYLRKMKLYKEPDLLKSFLKAKLPSMPIEPEYRPEPRPKSLLNYKTMSDIFLACIICVFMCIAYYIVVDDVQIQNKFISFLFFVISFILLLGTFIAVPYIPFYMTNAKKIKKVEDEYEEYLSHYQTQYQNKLSKYQEDIKKYQEEKLRIEKLNIEEEMNIKAENARRKETYQAEIEQIRKENYVYYLAFKDEAKRKYDKNIDEISKIGSSISEVSDKVKLNSKYYQYIDELIEYIEEGRADTVKEAINLLHNEWANEELINEARQKNDILESQSREQERYYREQEYRQEQQDREAREREYDRQRETERHNREMEEVAKKQAKSSVDLCIDCKRYWICGHKHRYTRQCFSQSFNNY